MNENTIKYGKYTFNPSKYQTIIFDAIRKGVNNIVINAVAGAGKTTTIVNALSLLEDKEVLFIAFNKDIVSALKEKIGNKKNVKIFTYHSLGYHMLKRVFKDTNYKIEIDEYKYRVYLKKNIQNLTLNNPYALGKVKMVTYINNISALVDYARFNLCQSTKEISDIAKKYGVTLILDEAEVTEKLLQWGKTNLDTIDYADMVWLPYELNLEHPSLKFDWVMIDEAQDSSLMQQELYKKCLARGAKFCAIGDKQQCINSWCGADPEAFDKFLEAPNTISLDLPISYRCPKSVIKLAQSLVPKIQATDDAIEGSVVYDENIYTPMPGDMVLCRNTAPLVELYMSYLRTNNKAYIVGKDIGTNLIDMIENTKQEYLGKSFVTDGVFARLYERLFEERGVMITKNGLDEKDATFSEPVMRLYDSIQSLEVLSEGLNRSSELIEKIKAIFIDNDKRDGIRLSTIHKAKGLEADNVYILCPSLMPSRLAKEKWEIDAEFNLIYVAYTRAKKKLAFMDETQFMSVNRFNNPDAILKELNIKMGKVSSVLNKSFVTDGGVVIKQKVVELQPKTTNITNLGIKTNSKPQNKKIGANKFGKFLK
jgi:superfamily I DNA/RNA helicase